MPRETNSSHSDRILILEPTCVGLEHSPFNAALVVALATGFPSSTICFAAESSHVSAVLEVIGLSRPEQARRIEPLIVPGVSRRTGTLKRVRSLVHMFRLLSSQVTHFGTSIVVLASADSGSIVMIKSFMQLFRSRAPRALAVLHEAIAIVGRDGGRRSRRLAMAVSTAMPAPGQFKFLVLGEGILDEMRAVAPALARQTVAILHPSLLGDIGRGDAKTPGAGPAPQIRVGFVGGGREAKGLRDFGALCRSIGSRHRNVQFEIVGAVPPALGECLPPELIWSPARIPLPAFIDRIRALSCVVWLGDPSHYRLVASGSLIDCVSIGTPVICLDGPFVRTVFAAVDPPGARCATLQDIETLVMEMASSPNHALLRRDPQRHGGVAAGLRPEAWSEVLSKALS